MALWGPSTAENVPGSNDGFTTTFEIADERGMRVGNVSTAEITDATPAAPSSHISQRACQGPNDARNLCLSETKGKGGLGSIAEQQIDHLLDVNLGGGRNRFLQTTDAGGHGDRLRQNEGRRKSGVAPQLDLIGTASGPLPRY